jgi:formamidopyrimidine-DNA glycosylase
MPELPEVETIKLGLQKKIVGLKIKEVDLISPKSFFGQAQDVRNKKVLNVFRRAKMLGIELDGNITVLIHLKMTGQLIHDGGKRFIGGHPTADMIGPLPNSSTRVLFIFSDDSKLYFNDQRRFGWVKVIKGAELEVMNSEGLFFKLGPEPLEKEFTWEILKNNLLRHKLMPIKVSLMDQSVVSGVGNIYANEACFDAKVNPKTKVKDLTDDQFKKLHKGIIKCLQDGIKYGGASRAHFVDSDGHKGYFLDYAYVYGRDKHPCKVCKTEIKKIQLAGRGTFFCPKCQKEVE